MLELLKDMHPIAQAFVATCFTWLMTALGASVVFFVKDVNRKFLDGMLGFAAGVMIAVSYWSLLAPAIEMSEGKDLPVWFPPAAGFLMGAVFLRIVDRILPHLHAGLSMSEAEGIKTPWRRSTLLILALTLHNIPEGLSVGVAFGAAAPGLPSAALMGAVALSIGIGLHNFAEGIAASMPLRGEGMSRSKSFFYGQLSGVAEPVGGVIGAMAVMIATPVLPYAISFAAGAMIFVAVEALIPESQRAGNTDIATMGAIAGFVVMMVLAVGLG